MIPVLAYIGTGDVIVLVVLGLLFFGKRLPGLGRSVGETMGYCKRGFKEGPTNPEAAGNLKVETSVRPQPKLPAPRSRPQPKLLGPVAEEP